MLFGLLALLATFQQPPQNIATTPVDRNGEDWWRARHENCLKLTRAGKVEVAFLGDSITQGWEDSGKDSWAEATAGLRAANFGFSGDRTEHVLWRLDHGELLGSGARLVAIMIGTNNVGHGSSNPSQTVTGIRAILDRIHKGMPSTRILLLGVFPRDENPNDRLRLAVNEINDKIKNFADQKTVFFEPVGDAFVRPDGVLRTTLMPDRLHLNAEGYAVWAHAVGPLVKKLAG